MRIVLLSGGSGKRLWPISNDARAKQFLKVLENKDGNRESMAQRVWRQLTSVGLAGASIIATSKAQVDMIQSQLGNDISLIVEPERRDTFPAIALACTYFYSIEGLSLNEVIIVLPVDPYVQESFFNRVKELEQVIRQSDAELALMGVTPIFPSEKYGYIVPKREDGSMGVKQVDSFHEKPNEFLAKELIEQGALWNCGVFAFKLDKIISLLIEKGLPVQYDELRKQYARLPKISFDYEVVEKSENIVVLPYNGDWKDLGTWNTLTEEMTTNLIGKGIISDDCENIHVVNELDIPVAVLGLSNAVVAVSPDGILVTDKSSSPRVKEVAQFDQRPMYEERRWGWYRTLDYVKFEQGNEVLTKRICVKAGKNLSYQLHYKRSEVWTIISGEGEFVLNDKMFKVKPGDVLQIPVESKHAIKAITDLEFIEVQSGNQLIEEDIFRIFMSWEEIVRVCLK